MEFLDYVLARKSIGSTASGSSSGGSSGGDKSTFGVSVKGRIPKYDRGNAVVELINLFATSAIGATN